MTWHCSNVAEDLHRFARNLQHLLAKLFLLSFLSNFTVETIAKAIFRANAVNFLQICANLQKFWNNAVSNDGSKIELKDRYQIIYLCKEIPLHSPWVSRSVELIVRWELRMQCENLCTCQINQSNLFKKSFLLSLKLYNNS